MNKKGFTLVEVITTVALVSILMLIVIPSLLSQLSTKTDEASKQEQTMLEEAARVYVDKHHEEYKDVTNACITIEMLKKEGLYSTAGRSGTPLPDTKGVTYKVQNGNPTFNYGC
jgi:prepilin-type N-terminal cleavage/methylation domain-containing protein